MADVAWAGRGWTQQRKRNSASLEQERERRLEGADCGPWAFIADRVGGSHFSYDGDRGTAEADAPLPQSHQWKNTMGAAGFGWAAGEEEFAQQLCQRDAGDGWAAGLCRVSRSAECAAGLL